MTLNVDVNSCKASRPVPPAEDSGAQSPCRKQMGKCLGRPEGTSADVGGEPDRAVSWAGLCGLSLSFCISVSVCQEPGNSPQPLFTALPSVTPEPVSTKLGCPPASPSAVGLGVRPSVLPPIRGPSVVFFLLPLRTFCVTYMF